MVLAVPTEIHRVRFPLVVIAPMTTAAITSAALYPRLSAGMGGLGGDGTVLIDQVLAADVGRIEKHIGQLTTVEYQPIANGLRRLFGLP